MNRITRDTIEIAIHSRGTVGPEAQANYVELRMLITALTFALHRRPWLATRHCAQGHTRLSRSVLGLAGEPSRAHGGSQWHP